MIQLYSDSQACSLIRFLIRFDVDSFGYTVLCKSLRPLVFSPEKSQLFFIFCYRLNISLAINCNNPVRLLSGNSQCFTERSDLIIIHSVWNDMKKQNKLRRLQDDFAQYCISDAMHAKLLQGKKTQLML